MEMDGGDDGDHAVAGLKSALDESLQDVQERSIVLVNVNYVLGKNHLTPEVKGTGLINRHLPRRSLVDFHWKSKNCLLENVALYRHPPTGNRSNQVPFVPPRKMLSLPPA